MRVMSLMTEDCLVERDMSSMPRHLMKDVLGGRDESRNEKSNEKESCHVAVVAKEAAMNRSLIPSPLTPHINCGLEINKT